MEKTTIKLFLVDGDPNGIIKCTFLQVGRNVLTKYLNQI